MNEFSIKPNLQILFEKRNIKDDEIEKKLQKYAEEKESKIMIGKLI